MNKNMKMRLAAMPLALAAVAAPALSGCGEDNPLCCNEGDFQVGGTISGEYSAEVKVALQAVADIGGIASASIDDLTTACRSIAEGLDATPEEKKAADANPDKREKMNAWCALAVSAIGTVKAQAGGTLTLDIQPPQCSASVSAKANCQASCSGSAECDIQANPPTCEGGKLEVSCEGSCTAEAGASVSCTGSCSGSCSGECTAEGGVECAGKCEGTCTASAGGTGPQADGSCQGTCSGTCAVTAPSASCSGSCNGQCDAACEASAGASVKCDGQCDGNFEPLKCEGGELKGGCQVEAKCEGNCDASVKAKAECTPPSINIAFSGAADIQAAGKLKVVLEANLALVASLEARFTAVVEVMPVLVGNINADFLVDIKVACIPVVIAALGNAAGDVEASVSATASVMGSVGG